MNRLTFVFAFLPVLGLAQLTTTSTTLTVNSPAGLGSPATLTSTVSDPSASGYVAFYDSGILLGRSPLANGSAQWTGSNLPPGANFVTARYLGDSVFAVSQSARVTLQVNATPVSGWSPVSIYGTESFSAAAAAVADVNGDGIPDIATAGTGVEVYLGDGKGGFQLSFTAQSESSFTTIAIADFNNDGKPDLAVSTQASNGVTIYLGNGDGTFQQGESASISAGASFIVADFNMDGNADILPYSGTVYLGNGDGTFREGVPLGFQLQHAAVGDLNGDGIPDLVIAVPGTVQTYLGTGDGRFQNPIPYSTTAIVSQILIADLNGDGEPDVLLLGSSAVPLMGNGSGALYASSGACISGTNIGNGVLSDWNNDGVLDAAIFPSSPLGTIPTTVLGPLTAAYQAYGVCRPYGPPISASAIGSLSQALGSVAGVSLTGNGATDFVYANGALNVTLAIPAIQVSLNVGGAVGAYGQPVTLTATLSQPTLTGTVIFYDGVNIIGQAAVVNGVATLVTSALPPGTQQLTARFAGASGTGSGVSAPVSKGVIPRPSSGFVSAGVLPTGEAPAAVVTADFNHDGFADFAVANAVDNSISILLGSASGVFTAGTPLTTGVGPSALAIGDFNRDGIPDLAVAEAGIAAVDVFLGNGNGGFQQKVSLYAPVNVDSLALADFNRDGIIDIAAAGLNGYASIFIGNGDGSFQAPVTSYEEADIYGIAAADLNGDGYPDLAEAVSTSDDYGEFSIGVNSNLMLNQSNCPNTLPNPVGVALDDFNGDGVLDIALAAFGDQYTGLGGGAGILLSNGTYPLCHYALYHQYNAGTDPLNIITGDMNGDGKEDIAVTNYEGFSFLPGNGDGTFGTLQNYATTSAYALALGDFNGDGAVDIAVTNLYEDNLQLFLGVPVPCKYSLNTGSIYFDKNGGTFTVTVAVNGPSCAWTATTASPFVQLSQAGGSGNGSVVVTVSPNTTGTELIGSVVIAGNTIPVTEWITTQVFDDVPPTDYYFDAVNELKQKGITSGCTATDYCPAEDIPRSQMAVFLVRAVFGGDNFTYNPVPYFTDVPASAFGFAWVQKLYELGITTGCGPDLFCPNSNVTRDQMAVFIIRMRYGASFAFTYPATPYFSDVPPTAFGFSYIQRMKLDNITSGCTATTYCPSNPVTRGDMAIFMMRAGFNQLLPANEPILTSVVPATIQPGVSTTVTITGLNTNFSAMASTLSMAGITVGAITVNSPTSLTAVLTPGPQPPASPVSIVAITGSEQAVLPNGLVVQ